MKTRAEIEQHVEFLLTKHKVSQPPVPVKRIAVAENVPVVESAFRDDVSGALIRSNGTAVIAVNVTHHPNRQRFTVAHELAHFFLRHRDSDHVDWKFTVLRRDQRSSEATDEHEIEANSFAANLLMPKHFIRRDIAQLTKFNGEIVLGDEDIRSLSKRYEVSVKAMNYRLISLGLLDPNDDR
jgi:Zn-dependent peptidase ImmA (M78 family)